MGAREDVLAAARAIEAAGVVAWSPEQLVREARAQGSTYAESTLRKYVTSRMCAGVADGDRASYSDLIRVSRGLYRLL